MLLEASIALAVVNTVVQQYVFSFQRFTLGIARKHMPLMPQIAEIQIMMTPTLMGAVGWICLPVSIAAAVLLGIASFWWVGVLYFLFDFCLAKALLPPFPFKNHFARMARRELESQHEQSPHPFVAALIADVGNAKHEALV